MYSSVIPGDGDFMCAQPLLKAMTVSGSDSSGGAGVQADLRTFAALGLYGMSVVTAVTAQNTIEVSAIAEVPEEVVIAQIDAVMHDIGADTAKTGMLSSGPILENTVDRLEAWGPKYLVVDPVMISRGGVALLQPDALEALKNELIPMATVVTPNVAEAETILGRQIASPAHAREAARAISAMGPETVVITRAFNDGSFTDLVYHKGVMTPVEGTPVDTNNTHGIGDTFSAAITALLAYGVETVEAVRLAKRYVENSLTYAVAIGEGTSPLAHFAPLPEELRTITGGVHR